MSENLENRISSTQAKDAIYKAHSISSSASEIDDAVGFVQIGKNLVNPNTYSLKTYINYTNGVESSVSTWTSTDFIEVAPNENYSFVTTKTLVWYDANKNFISGFNSPTSPQVVPSNANYARVTFHTDGWGDVYQFEKGLYSTSYEEYKGNFIKPTYTTKPLETTFYGTTKNMLNKEEMLYGYYIKHSTGAIVQSSLLSASGFIPIQASTSYILSGVGTVGWAAWYDDTYTFISGVENLRTASTSPVGAKYIRVTSYIDSLDTAQLEENTKKTYYIPYSIQKNDYKEFSNNIKDASWATLGDSITFQGNWQPIVYSDNQLIFTNHGIGGTKISGSTNQSFVHNDRVNGIDINTDIISVLGGTNDWGMSVPLGAEDSTNIEEFNGALNVLIQKLCTRFPSKKIIFMTLPYGEVNAYIDERSWTDANTNKLGLGTLDYANAIKNACLKSSIPCIDIHTECGWNTNNLYSYCSDGVHPSAETGGARLGNVVSKAFKDMGL